MPTYKNKASQKVLVDKITFEPLEQKVLVSHPFDKHNALDLIDVRPFTLNPLVMDQDFNFSSNEIKEIPVSSEITRIKIWVRSGQVTLYRDSVENAPGYRLFKDEYFLVDDVETTMRVLVIQAQEESKIRIAMSVRLFD